MVTAARASSRPSYGVGRCVRKKAARVGPPCPGIRRGFDLILRLPRQDSEVCQCSLCRDSPIKRDQTHSNSHARESGAVPKFFLRLPASPELDITQDYRTSETASGESRLEQNGPFCSRTGRCWRRRGDNSFDSLYQIVHPIHVEAHLLFIYLVVL